MNAVKKQLLDAEVVINTRGKIYRFLSLCFAYPDSSTHSWWQKVKTTGEILDVVSDLDGSAAFVTGLKPKLEELAEEFSRLTIDELESTYISMFVCGVPQVLCPPYSSLYSSADDDKRLTEIHKVNAFYEEYGMMIAPDFKDLPDHASVEFEFLHYLAYEEELARSLGRNDRVEFFQKAALRFLDRHVLKLIDGMAAVAATVKPKNLGCQIIDIVGDIVRFDHESLVTIKRENSHG